MIFLYHARLLILSQPKTGTTALDHALAHRASMVVGNPPQLKHVTYRKFMKMLAPFIKMQTGLERADYEIVSVMREPVDWLGSWYRYRTREQLKGGNKNKQNYTGDVSFEEFVLEVLKPKGERAPYANVGSPCGVALANDGRIGVDRIYPYEDLSGLYGLINERTGIPVETRQLNTSPTMELELTDETRARLRDQWRFVFDLHASLTPDGNLDPRFIPGDKSTEDADA